MKIRQGRDTMLVAGVPQSRGTPVHFEHDDRTAFARFNSAGKVTELHTPHHGLIRIHELLHARHTSQKRFNRVFAKVQDQAAQICEDVRIHARHWPWSEGNTPLSVARSAQAYCTAEIRDTDEGLKKRPELRCSWPDFATRLRVAAIMGSISDGHSSAVASAGFADASQERMARQVIGMLRKNKEAEAAAMIATVFDLWKEPPPIIILGGGGGKGFNETPWLKDERPIIRLPGARQPVMEIIDLPKSEHVEGTAISERRATMGSRMYRPALRRPLLPQRMFVRRRPAEPGGTILIDASGSMGDFELIAQWCKRVPFGTVAYYAGNGRDKGWLWIYSRDGRRCAEIAEPEERGNTVDGPALAWLMQQNSPRIMVTDRDFCDVPDSYLQVARLAQLEREGEVTVLDYNDMEKGE